MLKFGNRTEEFLEFVRGAKPHDPLNAGAIVPTTVEQHDFANGRQMRRRSAGNTTDALAFGGRRQRDHAADARIEALRDAFDSATLAGESRPSKITTTLSFLC